jgi:hypothetical protein
MVRCDGDSESNKIAASEALVAYHTACNGQSFRANDCLLTLIKKIYEPKFSSACTKSQAIITNVLSPYTLGEVIKDLNKTKSITVSLYVSNKKDIKTFSNRCAVLFAKLWCPRQNYRFYFLTW